MMKVQVQPSERKQHLRRLALTGLAMVTVGGLIFTSASTAQAATGVGLGTADGFAVLGGSGITNTGPTTVNGDVGTFPTTTITGVGSLTITGTNHAGDAVTQLAKDDLVTAYNAAAGQASDQTISADLGGMTLVSGVYTSASSLGLTGTLILDAAGNPNGVFIFQAGSTLTTASGSSVSLINGAQACNVYWQVGSSATLGTSTDFQGTILALTSITLDTGATVDGRVLARDGAVTLDTNTISISRCTVTLSTSTSTSTSGSGAAYAANIGPLAQGLVCPWGGQYNNAGLCIGSGANSLMNPSTTPSDTSATTPLVTPSDTPPATPVVTSAIAPTGAIFTPVVGPVRQPVAAVQVPFKPVGGVNTGDHSNN